MDCREIARLLPLYTDTTCSDMCLTEMELKAMEAHLAACPGCAREVQTFCRMVDLVKGVAPVKVPEDFCSRVMDRLAEAETPAPRRTSWFWPMLTAGSVAAAAAVLVLLLYPSGLRPDLPLTAPGPATLNAPPALRTAKTSTTTRSEISESASHGLSSLKFARIAPAQPTAEEEASGSTPTHGLALQRPLSQRALYRADYTLPPAVFAGMPMQSALAEPAGGMAVAQWTGEHSALSRPEVVVARTPSECQALWERSGIAPIPETATLRWGREMLVAVFLGDQPGTGLSVHLLGVQAVGQQLVLGYRVQGPDPDTTETERSQPYLLAVLGASDLPVVARPAP
jgi:hypothetical protein